MGEAHVVVTAHKERRLQKRTVRRRLFGKALQEIFLAELAASCNVRRAARKARVAASTAYLKRRTCPLFRAAWQEALEEGYVRLETALVERALASFERPRVEASGRAPEIAPINSFTALGILREHKRGLAGLPHNRTGPVTRSNIEACDRLEKKLKALRIRISRPGSDAPA